MRDACGKIELDEIPQGVARRLIYRPRQASIFYLWRDKTLNFSTLFFEYPFSFDICLCRFVSHVMIKILIIGRGNKDGQVANEDLLVAIQEVAGDVNEIKTDVSNLKTEVSVLKSDVNVLKSDVSTLKSAMREVRQDISRIDYRFKVYIDDLGEARTGIAMLQSKIKYRIGWFDIYMNEICYRRFNGLDKIQLIETLNRIYFFRLIYIEVVALLIINPLFPISTRVTYF